MVYDCRRHTPRIWNLESQNIKCWMYILYMYKHGDDNVSFSSDNGGPPNVQTPNGPPPQNH